MDVCLIEADSQAGSRREYSSAKTMDSLRSLASPSAQVIRDGKSITIPSHEVVVGDLVEVKTGEFGTSSWGESY